MGISLKDFGNFAVGAIERDKEITKEDLAIKADELTANRDFLIKQKEKKYDKELEQYYKEKEKFDTINQANKMYNLGSVDARTYAATILPITNPNWKNLDEKTKQLNINNFDGKTIDYKLIGNPEEISKQAALINNKINSVTSEAIKNAKGDRFLINKILGQKKKAEADLLEEVENKIKAADAVKMSEQNVNQEYVGKEVKVNAGGLYGNIDKTSKEYTNFVDKNYEQIKKITELNSKVTSKDNNEAIKETFKLLGITNAKDYFSEDKQSGEIIGFKKGGESFGNTVYSTYKQYQDFLKKDGTDYLYVKFNGDIADLPAYYGKQNLNGTLANRTFNYGVPVANNAILGEGGKLDFKTVLRNEDNLIVVPTGNTINFDDTVFGTTKVLTDKEKKLVGEIYAKTLMTISSEEVDGKLQLNPLLLKQNQSRLQNLKYGEGNSELLNEVNLTFGIRLVEEGILSKEQFLSNNAFNYFYNNDETVKNLINKAAPSIITDKTGKKDTDKKTMKVTINGTTVTMLDTIESRNQINKDIKDGADIVIQEEIVRPEKVIDTIVNSDVIKSSKLKTPSDFGIKNKPVFENINEVQQVLQFPMSGKDIKEQFDINFPVNEKTIFRPVS